MNLNRLLPNSQKNKKEEAIQGILHLFLCEWGWSFEEFKKTPIPITVMLLKKHKKDVEKQKKKNGKK